MTEPAETPVATVERVYRSERAKGTPAVPAMAIAHNESVKNIHQMGLRGDDKTRAIREADDALEALAGPDVAEEIADKAERKLGIGELSEEIAQSMRETADSLRQKGHLSDADRVEIALCRAALRAVVALSNEGPVRRLAMAARGM